MDDSVANLIFGKRMIDISAPLIDRIKFGIELIY